MLQYSFLKNDEKRENINDFLSEKFPSPPKKTGINLRSPEYRKGGRTELAKFFLK